MDLALFVIIQNNHTSHRSEAVMRRYALFYLAIALANVVSCDLFSSNPDKDTPSNIGAAMSGTWFLVLEQYYICSCPAENVDTTYDVADTIEIVALDSARLVAHRKDLDFDCYAVIDIGSEISGVLFEHGYYSEVDPEDSVTATVRIAQSGNHLTISEELLHPSGCFERWIGTYSRYDGVVPPSSWPVDTCPW